MGRRIKKIENTTKQIESDAERKIDNKSNIIDIALDLFYARGYEAVGVQEIAATAGVTKPTLYYYFKSKYGLLESVLEATIGNFIETIKNAVNESRGLENGLMNVATAYINYVTKDDKKRKEFYMFLSMEYSPKESESHKAIEKYEKEIFMIFLNLFIGNAAALGNMNGRQEHFAMGFMGILNYYLLVCLDRSKEDSTYTVEQGEIYSLVHQFMHGIYS